MNNLNQIHLAFLTFLKKISLIRQAISNQKARKARWRPDINAQPGSLWITIVSLPWLNHLCWCLHLIEADGWMRTRIGSMDLRSGNRLRKARFGAVGTRVPSLRLKAPCLASLDLALVSMHLTVIEKAWELKPGPEKRVKWGARQNLTSCAFLKKIVICLAIKIKD